MIRTVDVALVAGVENEAGDIFLLFLVHAGHRLVKDQKFGLSHQRARQLHPLLQADGDDLDRLVADVLELHELDNLFDHAAVGQFLLLGPPPVEQRRRARSDACGCGGRA
jgi:hypothetical protein